MEHHKAFVGATASVLTTLITLGGGLIVGQALTARWNVHVKERESDLSSIQRLREPYGKYLSAIRLWDYHCTKDQLGAGDPRLLDMLDHASAAEGEIEGS